LQQAQDTPRAEKTQILNISSFRKLTKSENPRRSQWSGKLSVGGFSEQLGGLRKLAAFENREGAGGVENSQFADFQSNLTSLGKLAAVGGFSEQLGEFWKTGSSWRVFRVT
jgi:hypothetical protein